MFFMKKKFKYVCAVDSAYSLYLYFLIHHHKIDETLFVVSDGIPNEVISNLNNKIYVNSHKSKKLSFLKRFISAISLKYFTLPKFINSASEFYGQDHLFYSFAVLGKKFTLLEDGLGNYVQHSSSVQSRMREFLLQGKEWGYSDKAINVLLTGIEKIPDGLAKKVTLVDTNDLWRRKTSSEKARIKKIFNVEFTIDNDSENGTIVLLTQPFSEDGVISEYDKIGIYREILNNYQSNVIIKPHPRESTNYSTHFPDHTVLSGSFPFQLVAQELEPLKIVTCFSSIKSDGVKVLKHMYGTQMNEKLLSFYGLHAEEYDDFS